MHGQAAGPPMICATQVMRTGPTRIGKVAGVQLGRTVPVLTLFATAGAALVGLLIGAATHPGLTSMLYGAAFGGAGGYTLVTYSPLQGESMLKWLELQFHATRRSRYINGERVLLAVGTGVLPSPPRGAVRLQRGAVRVPAAQYDGRGVLISPANRNVPVTGDRLLSAALALPGEDRMTLTPASGIEFSASRRARAQRATPSGPTTPAKPNPTSRPRRLKD